MRTKLGAFASDFEANLLTVLGALRRLADDPATPEYLHVEDDLTALHEGCEALATRVSSEEAYVLIFGPLKSGKSTLMNALSEAYVSEVGSLPGYPCLVQVSHADEPSFRVIHYNGQEEDFADLAAMRIYAQRSHGTLAERLREAEAAGETFDAEGGCPEAIRRIEVKMPTSALARASATLVDTPGLYSRMKFDYDRLTHEYRDVASCAVFVVKSDNLFLEQVFIEFGELLNLFKRVFLIVNVDTKKLDVGPDGELVQSLEQTDPARVIEAFENLSMPTEMRRAADEGRLRIYPIDLLSAASRRLRAGETVERAAVPVESVTPVESATAPAEAETEQGGEPVEASLAAEETAASERTQSRFDTFLDELTSYLNGSEHLNDFVEDSLRRLDGVLAGIVDVCGQPEVLELSDRLLEKENERDHVEARRAATQRLGERHWEGSFEELRESLTTRTRELADRVAQSNRSEIGEVVDAWLKSNASVRSLVEEDLVPLFSRAYKNLFVGVCRTLARETERPSGGAGTAGSLLEDLREADLALDQLARSIVERVESAEPMPSVSPPLATADVPVRKGFWGWLFFRSRNKVRLRLLGPESNPDLQLPAKKKEKHLHPQVGVTIRDLVAERLSEFLSTNAMDLRAGLMERYVKHFTQELGLRLRSDLTLITEKKQRLVAECAALQRLRDELDHLELEAQEARAGIPPLAGRYTAPPEPIHVLEPQPAPEEAVEEPASDVEEKLGVETAEPAREPLTEPSPGV